MPQKVVDIFSTIFGLLNPLNTLIGIGAIAFAVFQGRWNDIAIDWKNGCFNPFNQSEKIALESNVFSFYKGESVIRHNIPNTTSCQIFGSIFLNISASFNCDGINTIKHEFGHGVQEKIIGPFYLLNVALPSVLYFFYDSRHPSEYNYYSNPWERTADYFGGVKRQVGYKKGSLAWGYMGIIFGPVAELLYLLFGY